MKPAAFEYAAPRTLDEALALLDGDDDVKAIAGGQSLVPVMNFRLATPARLVDLNGIAELAYLRRHDGTLRIGALTRHATLEHSELIARAAPLLRQAVKHVGHPAIRTRGTIGGSCSHADPTAELPVALTALDARFHLRSRAGRRVLAASDFFVAQLTTALAEGELVVEVEIPPLPPGARTAFKEYARTHGDWAICGVAVVVAPASDAAPASASAAPALASAAPASAGAAPASADGSAASAGAPRAHAAIALLGAGPTPRRAPEAEVALRAGASAAEAAALAGALLADPWKRSLTTSLVRDALLEAGA